MYRFALNISRLGWCGGWRLHLLQVKQINKISEHPIPRPLTLHEVIISVLYATLTLYLNLISSLANSITFLNHVFGADPERYHIPTWLITKWNHELSTSVVSKNLRLAVRDISFTHLTVSSRWCNASKKTLNPLRGQRRHILFLHTRQTLIGYIQYHSQLRYLQCINNHTFISVVAVSSVRI